MKAFSNLQKIGKALMTPVALLPAAGLLLAFGQSNVLDIPIMAEAGGVIFSNLPLLFAVGVGIGLAGGDGVAALASIVAFLIMNITMGHIAGVTADMVSQPAYASVLGIPTLETGVFGGIIAGVIGAAMFNKFYKIELPPFLGFFAGKRFVPIATAFLAFGIGLIMPTVWQPIQLGLSKLSYLAIQGNSHVATFIFGLIERALIPFGLHHIFYSPFWFQFGEYTNAAGDLVQGDQAIFFAQLQDNVKITAGKFMTGKYPFMMFGLPAAALAMYHEAKEHKRKIVGGILFSAALTSFLTGITEPIEFSFLFVAPLLFGIHVVFAGLSFMIMDWLGVRIGMTFSGGAIDYTLFGILPNQTKWWLVIPVGLGIAVIYYFMFRFAIRKFDLKTPGREDEELEEEVKLGDHEKAVLILDALGGKDNIKNLTSCITRLRINVKDTGVVDEKELKKLGASGVLKVGSDGVQVIMGTKAGNIEDDMQKLL